MTNIQGLWLFTFCNYLDKALNFLTPFLILFFFRNSEIYGSVEYLIAISLIFSSFLDFGLRSYLFYGYKNTNDYKQFCEIAANATTILLSFYTFLFVCFSFVFGIKEILLYCFARTLFLIYINIKSSIYRLEDRPTSIFLFSIGSNAAIILLLLFCVFFKVEFKLLYYSFPYFIFLVAILLSLFLNFKKHINFLLEYKTLIQNTVSFAWPIIITLVINSFQNNFLRIYGYNNLTFEEYGSLSVFLRFFTIVILAHTSAINFYTKDIYKYKGNFSLAIYKKYLLLLILSFVLMIWTISVSNKFEILAPVDFNIDFIIMLLTFLVMTNRAFLELYFGKHNKLKLLLIPNAISILVILFIYIILLRLNKIELTSIISLLFASELINISIVFMLYKQFIFKRI